MKAKRFIIYVPGIHDDVLRGQSFLLMFWRLFGVSTRCHVMPWLGAEAFQPKFERLLHEIDAHVVAGQQVSLVGASAGASAVVQAYAARKDRIGHVVLMCPKINNPDNVSPAIYKANSAFKTALYDLQKLLPALTPADKAKMLTLYSPVDTTVPYADTVITGVTAEKLPALKHGVAIIYSITVKARRITRFVKTTN